MDIGSSPAEFLYGTTFRIPGEFVLPDDFNPDPKIFLKEFLEHIRSIKAVPVRHHYKKRVILHKDLKTCSDVFLSVGIVKTSLKRLYTGPHKIIKRTSDRVFEIDVNGSSRYMSVENIKPAYFLRQDICNPSSRKVSSDNVNDVNKETSTDVNKETASNVTPTISAYSHRKKIQFNL